MSENNSNSRKGSLEVICGCMYSGKTEELIRRIRREQIAGRKVQAIKSHRDTRYSIRSVQSHTGITFEAIRVKSSIGESLLKVVDPNVDVVAIDEIQFFDLETAYVCDGLAETGYRVIVAGLDLDFRGEPFRGPMATLLSKADKLTKLTAICVICGETATRTQRLVNDKPAEWDEAIYVVGGNDSFEAVCRAHHRINRPSREERQKTYKVIENPFKNTD